jgi:hypothetical protein
MKDYFKALRELEQEMIQELNNHFKRLGGISIEKNEDVSWFNFATICELEIDDINSDGVVVSGYQKGNTIASLINSGTIITADAICLINDLRDIK